MNIEQIRWSEQKGWDPHPPEELGDKADLVFIFSSKTIIKDGKQLDELKKHYTRAKFMGCSTAGEICGTEVTDDTLVVTAVQLEHTQIQSVCLPIEKMDDSFKIGEQLVDALDAEGLVHVFVLSEGLNVNGSELVKGITKHLPEGVTVTGGLSGDGDQFQETLVICNDNSASNKICMIGFYGSQLKIGYGSLGGWDPFGIDRVITKSNSNILYELDGQSALALYKEYLGEHADKLPASGLLFPLSIKMEDNPQWIVRTILSVSEEDQSMTFAGDMPEGATARLMKANFERLIDGASEAAKGSYQALGSGIPELALLISCVGRKMVLKQRIEEEVESVREVLGNDTVLAGFYSYGEISPFTLNAKCELHNQTMTVTTFSEA